MTATVLSFDRNSDDDAKGSDKNGRISKFKHQPLCNGVKQDGQPCGQPATSNGRCRHHGGQPKKKTQAFEPDPELIAFVQAKLAREKELAACMASSPTPGEKPLQEWTPEQLKARARQRLVLQEMDVYEVMGEMFNWLDMMSARMLEYTHSPDTPNHLKLTACNQVIEFQVTKKLQILKLTGYFKAKGYESSLNGAELADSKPDIMQMMQDLLDSSRAEDEYLR